MEIICYVLCANKTFSGDSIGEAALQQVPPPFRTGCWGPPNYLFVPFFFFLEMKFLHFLFFILFSQSKQCFWILFKQRTNFALSQTVTQTWSNYLNKIFSDILLYLLEHSPDHPETGHQEAIDTANGDGRTCLHIAALTNNLWLCKTLLANNAHVNAVMTNKVSH